MILSVTFLVPLRNNLVCLILCFYFSKSHETSGNVKDQEQEEQERDKQEELKEKEEGLLQLRSELMNYDFHKCPRIKKEAFQDLVVEDIDLIRIAVIGPTGAGKTSLVGEKSSPFEISTAHI